MGLVVISLETWGENGKRGKRDGDTWKFETI